MTSPGPASVNSLLFDTGRYSDLTVKCGSSSFKVHRAIVCIQSKPLAAAVDGNFKESITNTIDLDDNEPEIVECMLRFLYTSDYSDVDVMTKTTPENCRAQNEQNNRTYSPSEANTWAIIEEHVRNDFVSEVRAETEDKHGVNLVDLAVGSPFEEDSNDPLLTNTKVYIIGDKYDIPGLKELAKKKYEEKLATKWKTPAFSASLELLFEETVQSDRMLKDVAINAAGQHIRELVERREFGTLCRENGDIAFEVLKASLVAKPAIQTGDTRKPAKRLSRPSF